MLLGAAVMVLGGGGCDPCIVLIKCWSGTTGDLFPALGVHKENLDLTTCFLSRSEMILFSVIYENVCDFY